jgi:hypothetical protein
MLRVLRTHKSFTGAVFPPSRNNRITCYPSYQLQLSICEPIDAYTSLALGEMFKSQIDDDVAASEVHSMECLKSAEDCSGGVFEFIYVFTLAFINCTHCYSFMYRPPVLTRATAPPMLINVIRLEDDSICGRNVLKIQHDFI